MTFLKNPGNSKESLEKNSSIEFIEIMMHNAQVHLGTNRTKVTGPNHFYHMNIIEREDGDGL